MATCNESDADGLSAERAWRVTCAALGTADADQSWRQLAAASPSPQLWHSLHHCVAYQVAEWERLERSGAALVVQPAGFRLALLLRHTPPALAAALLPDLLRHHTQAQDLTSYILALVTEDEAAGAGGATSPGGPAPARDLQLFADCELAVLAAPQSVYDDHARRTRAEYPQLSDSQFMELRIRVLDQLCKIPRLYHTPEFQHLEAAARENVQREILSLKQSKLL